MQQRRWQGATRSGREGRWQVEDEGRDRPRGSERCEDGLLVTRRRGGSRSECVSPNVMNELLEASPSLLPRPVSHGA